jgi:hypothetical protein
MSEYCFGSGPGWLSKAADRAAKREGAELYNFTDAQCLCGHGCRPHACLESRRHWFAVPNRGFPFDQETEARVMAAVRAVATKRDKELFAEAAELDI